MTRWAKGSGSNSQVAMDGTVVDGGAGIMHRAPINLTHLRIVFSWADDGIGEFDLDFLKALEIADCEPGQHRHHVRRLHAFGSLSAASTAKGPDGTSSGAGS